MFAVGKLRQLIGESGLVEDLVRAGYLDFLGDELIELAADRGALDIMLERSARKYSGQRRDA